MKCFTHREILRPKSQSRKMIRIIFHVTIRQSGEVCGKHEGFLAIMGRVSAFLLALAQNNARAIGGTFKLSGYQCMHNNIARTGTTLWTRWCVSVPLKALIHIAFRVVAIPSGRTTSERALIRARGQMLIHNKNPSYLG